MITGPDHLEKVARDIVLWTSQAVSGWLDEDAASAMPLQGGAGGSRTGPADPVSSLVAAGRRTGARDRIAQHLLRAHRALRDAHLELTPRAPSEPCRCCKTEMATTAPDEHGRWTACPACDRFRREWGTRCGDDVHQLRPRVRMCDCPDSCCEAGTCTDRAADGRTVSERCLKRQYRSRQAG